MKLSAFTMFTLLLALPACGEDKDDTDTDTATATMTATAATMTTGTDGTTGGTTTGDTTGEATTVATDGTATAPTTTATDTTDATTATTATDTTDATGTTAEATTGEEETSTMTTGSAGSSFATDVWAPILKSQCGCHEVNAAGGLLMGGDADSAYASMVGVPSSKGMDYVSPGDPAASYVFHKIDGTQGEVGGGGARMPLGAPALDAAQIDVIEAWIADGANK